MIATVGNWLRIVEPSFVVKGTWGGDVQDGHARNGCDVGCCCERKIRRARCVLAGCLTFEVGSLALSLRSGGADF